MTAPSARRDRTSRSTWPRSGNSCPLRRREQPLRAVDSVELELAGSIAARGAAFGVETAELDTTDVEVIHEAAGQAIARIRETGAPFFLVLDTYRFSPHSSDDQRDPAEIEERRTRDPLKIAAPASQTTSAVRSRSAANSGSPRPSKLRMPLPLRLRRPRDSHAETLRPGAERDAARAFASRDDVYLFGEDILDPYGGAFKVTHGLSDAYPDRVVTTPISEASLFGVAAGMALAGSGRSSRSCSGTSSHWASTRSSTGSQVPGDVRRPGDGAAGRAHADGWPPRLRADAQPVAREAPPRHSEHLRRRGERVPRPARPVDELVEDEQPVFFIENKLMYGRVNRRRGWSGRSALRPRAVVLSGLTFRAPTSRASATIEHRRHGPRRPRRGHGADPRARDLLRGGCALAASPHGARRGPPVGRPQRSARHGRGGHVTGGFEPRSRRACRRRPGAISVRRSGASRHATGSSRRLVRSRTRCSPLHTTSWRRSPRSKA